MTQRSRKHSWRGRREVGVPQRGSRYGTGWGGVDSMRIPLLKAKEKPGEEEFKVLENGRLLA